VTLSDSVLGQSEIRVLLHHDDGVSVSNEETTLSKVKAKTIANSTMVHLIAIAIATPERRWSCWAFFFSTASPRVRWSFEGRHSRRRCKGRPDRGTMMHGVHGCRACAL